MVKGSNGREAKGAAAAAWMEIQQGVAERDKIVTQPNSVGAGMCVSINLSSVVE